MGTRKPPRTRSPFRRGTDGCRHLGAVVAGEHHDRVVGDAECVHLREQLADDPVPLRHRVCEQTEAGLAVPFLRQMCEGVTSVEVFDVFLAQATGVEAPKAKDRRTQSTKLRDHLDQIEAGQVSNCAVCRCRRRVPVGCVGQAFRLAVAFRFGLWSADILGDCRNISSAWPRSSAPDIVAAAGILVFANSSHSHKIAPMFC